MDFPTDGPTMEGSREKMNRHVRAPSTVQTLLRVETATPEPTVETTNVLARKRRERFKFPWFMGEMRHTNSSNSARSGRLPRRRPDLSGAGSHTSADTRTRILAAARRHFFTLGFASCSMDCLAAELGMSKKTLYQHFRRKEQIIDELMTLKTTAIRDGFEAVLAEEGITFAERAGRMLRHAHEQLSEVSAVFLHDLRRFHPACYARVEEFRAQVAPGVWSRLLHVGMEAGVVRPDVDPAFVGKLIPVAMQALLHPETLQRFSLQPHEMLERFFHLFFAGVLTPAGLAEHASIHSLR